MKYVKQLAGERKKNCISEIILADISQQEQELDFRDWIKSKGI